MARTRPTVAVTYNKEVGGVSVLSIKRAMKSLQTNVVDADYRTIVPATKGLEQIFTDTNKFAAVWREAVGKASALLKDVDCLMLSGNGAMIDPRLYGQPYDSAEKTDLARSLSELALIHVAINRGMPLMGICGGHQIINVYFGGIIKDLQFDELLQQNMHEHEFVNVEPDSDLAKMMCYKTPTEIKEKFFGAHNQVIDLLGGVNLVNRNKDFLRPLAFSDALRKKLNQS